MQTRHTVYEEDISPGISSKNACASPKTISHIVLPVEEISDLVWGRPDNMARCGKQNHAGAEHQREEPAH